MMCSGGNDHCASFRGVGWVSNNQSVSGEMCFCTLILPLLPSIAPPPCYTHSARSRMQSSLLVRLPAVVGDVVHAPAGDRPPRPEARECRVREHSA